MTLGEIRRTMKIVESLPDDTLVFWDYCGYTADDEWIGQVAVNTDGETDTVSIKVQGEAYKS